MNAQDRSTLDATMANIERNRERNELNRRFGKRLRRQSHNLQNALRSEPEMEGRGE